MSAFRELSIRWKLTLATQPGSQWFRVGSGPQGCPHCDLPKKVAPGRYHLYRRL